MYTAPMEVNGELVEVEVIEEGDARVSWFSPHLLRPSVFLSMIAIAPVVGIVDFLV